MNDATAGLLVAVLANATTVWRTLAIALEHIPTAAFVIGTGGQLELANAAGKTRIAIEGGALATRLANACRDADPELHVTSVDGWLGRRLVIASSAGDVVECRAATAATRWGLTPRQRDVLGAVLRGHSNARVSLELGISERTVEVHVTAILVRAGCSSRAELVASVWLVR